MNDQPSKLAAFIAELRNRRVFRVAVVYAGVAFIVIQIIDGAFDYLKIPEWVGSLIIIMLAVGFPIAVGLAWAFDLTAEGLVRAKVEREPTAAKAPHHPLVGNKSLALIAVLAIIVAAWALLREPSPGAAPISSIAVLPLDNLMGDPDEEYFVDGMHDALTGEMSMISALRVIGRTSTLSYKGNPKPIPEIAEELNVDAVIEGSVFLFPDGETIRITAQLVATRPERHIWREEYLGDLIDILSMHKTIVQAIAEELGLALTPEEEADLASAPQVNPEAYNLYLKGWHFRILESKESIPKAVEYLEQSVALDPDFAQAWAALAHSYFMMLFLGHWDRDYAFNRMKQAIDKALELDPNNAQAHAVLGYYQYQFLRDISAAEASYRRALELDPDNTYALYEYGLALLWWGRPDEALAMEQRARELDPLNPLPLQGIAWVYGATRQYEKGLEHRQAILEISPGHPRGRSNLTGREKREILMQQGRYAEVAAGAEKAGDFWLQLRAEWALGNREKVYAVRDSLRSTGELQQREREDPLWAARFYAIMGDKEKALSLLERAYEDTNLGRRGLVYNPGFDSLRAEPRFKALLKKIGLREVFDQYGRRIR